MKRIWKEYFSFSRKERTAVLLLIGLIVLFLLLPEFYRVKNRAPEIPKELLAYTGKNEQVASKGDSIPERSMESSANEKDWPAKSITLFQFNPNTLSAAGFAQLGIPAKTIRTLLRYREKGGRFRKPDDIRKIWGIEKRLADILVPYVSMEPMASGIAGKPAALPEKPVQTSTIRRAIDVNMASEADWKSLPGIGEVLSKRIVRFRDMIGGFRELEQVKKTYGISDSLFQSLQPFLLLEPANIPKADLNKVSAKELSQLASIPFPVARSIIDYRKQNGPFQTMDDLKKLPWVSDSLLIRVQINMVVK